MTRTTRRRLATTAATVFLAAIFALTVIGTWAPADAAGPPAPAAHGPEPVEVQLLALDDLHGNLEPPPGSGGRVQTDHGGRR